MPLALVILPILIPTNLVHGRGDSFAVGKYSVNQTLYSNVTGLDQLAWGNVRPDKNSRYWVHLLLAVVVVVYTCFIFFDELRGYIRLRQAYLTSPQHRLRASATTVLVTAIPRKWCTFEALDGLYDVFPGGIRNIWVNRNYDELSEKVKMREGVALALESAETALIKNAKKAYLKKLKSEAKKAGKAGNKAEKEEKLDQRASNMDGAAMAETAGISSGNPHQVRHTVDEALADASNGPSRERSPERKKPFVPISVIGQGIEAVGHGIDNIGRTVFKGFKQVGKDVDDRLNTTGGFVPNTSTPTVGSSELSHDNARLDLNTTAETSTGSDRHPHAHNASSQGKQPFRQPDDAVRNTSPDREGQLRAPADQRLPSQGNQFDFGGDGTNDDSRIADILHNPQRLGEAGNPHKAGLKFWNHRRSTPFGIPSPTPHRKEEDEFPLSVPSPITPSADPQETVNGLDSAEEANPGKSAKEKSGSQGNGYPVAYNAEYDPTDDGEPAWKTYLTEKDRDTMRLPIFGWSWMISLPLVGQKVDTINHCRKELARLNVEIEQDQREPEKFALMNSAFVQFNHQVAAHMACQAVSHHTPNHMAPRVVEISPDDVIWDNMSIRWWESYIRTGIVVLLIVGLIIGWAFPVTFTGLLSQVRYLTDHYTFLEWLSTAPTYVLSIIQGILPPLLLTLLLAALPIILRLLSRSQGDHTGMAVELSVQTYYFAFLFVQVFLVVSISSGITTVLNQISNGPQSVPSILASNLPKASNYFFSYLLLQALSVSAGALVQLMSLIKWFILAPLFDNTARQKWARQTSLPQMQWGTFFPVYTNLAAIGESSRRFRHDRGTNTSPGLIYSVISPLILIFNIITFSLFWLVYRYNTLYVTKFRFDTGGLLYPKAINQLFTGLYVMELCLIGLFFLVRDADDAGRAVGTPCKGQAIVMIILFLLTILYQYLLNKAFGPLFRYLPITLEDEAVMRDEEFARAQEKRWNLTEGEEYGDDINDVLEKRARRSAEESKQAEEIEMKEIEARRERGRVDRRHLGSIVPSAMGNLLPAKGSWADRSRNQRARDSAMPGHDHFASLHRQHRKQVDPESQRSIVNPIGEALFSGLNDEIEDLTPEERDKLVQRAFQHEALRAKRPVIWIPRDELGISDDEIHRTQRFSKHIWISNEYTGLDGKARVVYRRSPPDFSEVDLIEL